MHCQSCGSDNPEGVKFCIECAAPFKSCCPNCGFENLPRAKFCGECAFPLATQPRPSVSSFKFQVSSSQPLIPSPQPPSSYTPKHLAERILAEQAVMEARGATDGERKTITALFADIKGSMDLIEPLDPEEARSIIDPALQLMMDAVHRYEFKLLSQTGCLLLETFSVSHGKAYPYLPLIDLLKNYFQITLQDDERKRREKVTGKVLTLDRSLEDTLPYLFTLLDVSESTSSLAQMDPQIRKRRTFDAIKRLLVRESLNQPLILIFEDLHWLDAETQAFLVLLGESMATARILLLVNYRPEYRHEWDNKSFYTQLRLDALGQDDAQALLTALLGDSADLQPLKQFIRQKTEGNPFFMEEIVQALREQEMLPDPRRVGTAHLNVGTHGFGLAPSTGHAPRPTDLHIPPTVQAVLASRIDRLPAEAKDLLQTLSVIGKEFSFSLLEQVVSKPEDELQRLLSHLQGREFIYEQPAFPEVEYTFKHALTQEVAYGSMLTEPQS